MKILRLELQGFKSFKDKTVVNFDQSITAVVGSNGCGKSNIVDALYWVMGDMSPKHLRGSTMVDVIFSGTKNTPPMDMAEVSLILERDPEKDPELPPQFQKNREIQITRRYYRHGESEYFINKTHCRLRDIQEFFMDTGIGAKSYSIIEQGAITRMVAQKPEERRLVIEDVAGIMKFKARRAETERKLEHSKNNLQRLDDIIKELQKQLTSLKRQADRAEKHETLRTELQDLELHIAGREWNERKDSSVQNQDRIQGLQNELLQLEENLGTHKEKYATLKESLESVEQKLLQRREERRSQELKIKDIETQLSTRQTKIENNDQRKTEHNASLEKMDLRQTELDSELKTLQEKAQSFEEKIEEVARKLEHKSEALNACKERVENTRKNNQAAQKELHEEEILQTKHTQEIQSTQKQIAQIMQRKEAISSSLESLEGDLQLHATEKDSTVQLLEAAFSERKDLEAAKEEIDKEVLNLEEQRSELQEKRDTAQEELTRLKVRCEHLESLEKNMEGIDAASRSLALYIQKSGHSRALLADAINVPQSLEIAVEAILGSNLQRVVASDLNRIDEYIEVLHETEDEKARHNRSSYFITDITRHYRESHSGRRDLSAYPIHEDSSLPPPSEQSSDNPSPVRPGPDNLVEETHYPELSVSGQQNSSISVSEYLHSNSEVIGPLMDLVQDHLNNSNDLPSDDKNDWTLLLEGSYVVRDRDSFREIAARIKGAPVTLVSLQGDVLFPDGRLELAALEKSDKDLSVNLVQRKRELHDLSQTLQEKESNLSEVNDQITEIAKSLGNCRERSRALTSKLVSLNPDMEKHSQFLRTVESTIARLLEKKEILGVEDRDKGLESTQLDAHIKDLTRELNSSEEKRLSLQKKSEEIKEQLTQVLEEQNLLEEEVQNQKKESDHEKSQLSEVQKTLAAAKQELHLSEVRKTQIHTELKDLEQSKELLQNEQKETEASMEQEKESLFEAIKKEEEAFSQTEVEKKSIEEIRNLVEGLNQKTQIQKEALHNLEQSVAVNDVELKSLQSRIFEQYQISFDEMPEEKLKELASPTDLEEPINTELGKKKIEDLKKKMERLGKINMVAMEEFQEKAKRHEYLYVQRQDIWDAITQLEEAIERFDRESKERFEETFHAVNNAFQKTFPVLFGGGSAELRLTDPENILESGVEIVAQPPGKKLQSVTLLSGGEKALTAVSLIFGIFSIKPSPFAVLDEVDAPLDDTNVARFNTQVRAMSEQSQIIIITHHKITMESSDALYGVTMQERGVSKIASARLREMSARA